MKCVQTGFTASRSSFSEPAVDPGFGYSNVPVPLLSLLLIGSDVTTSITAFFFSSLKRKLETKLSIMLYFYLML